MRQGVVDDLITKHIPRDSYPETWDIDGFSQSVDAAFNLALPLADWAKEEGITEEEMRERLQKAPMKTTRPASKGTAPRSTRYVEKQIILQALDHLWREHLLTLDHLRQVVGWRGMAQRDPLNEYKSEAFELFDELIAHLREATTSQLNRVEVAFEPPPQEILAPPTAPFVQDGLTTSATFAELSRPAAAPTGVQPAFGAGEVAASAADTLVQEPGASSIYGKVGRNQLCPLRFRQEVQALPWRYRLSAFRIDSI